VDGPIFPAGKREKRAGERTKKRQDKIEKGRKKTGEETKQKKK
jgi:hypothetical protein